MDTLDYALLSQEIPLETALLDIQCSDKDLGHKRQPMQGKRDKKEKEKEILHIKLKIIDLQHSTTIKTLPTKNREEKCLTEPTRTACLTLVSTVYIIYQSKNK